MAVAQSFALVTTDEGAASAAIVFAYASSRTTLPFLS
jgi:hypothetical protein